MAEATTTEFHEFVLQVGDGQDPETFDLICGVTSRSFNLTSETTDVNTPDCTDESKPFTKIRRIVSNDWDASGNATMADESYPMLREWKLSGLPKNVRLMHAKDAPVGGYYEGPALLTTLGHSADKSGDGIVTLDINIEAAGPVVWVDAT